MIMCLESPLLTQVPASTKYFKKSLLFVLPEKMQHLTLISFEALKWNECYHLSCHLNHCLGHST